MKKMNPTGYLLHEGETNGASYLAIATLKTSNRKTGPMVQIWFLLRDVNPVDCVKSGLDAQTVCQDCPFASGNGCYVNVGQAPNAIWKGYHRGIYPRLNPKDYGDVFGGKKVRFGAYGNPTLLPLSMAKAIASVSSGWTGYFHDWKTNPLAKEYGKYFMASTETQDSLRQALGLKFRVFHASAEKPEGAMDCLAETKNMSCADCQLCQGLSKARQPSIWINPHGSKASKAKAVLLST